MMGYTTYEMEREIENFDKFYQLKNLSGKEKHEKWMTRLTNARNQWSEWL